MKEQQATEWARKYRPHWLADVIGQDAAVKQLRAWMDQDTLPHCLLLAGPSGVGKTTIARCLRAELKISDLDYTNLNCSLLAKPIEVFRKIRHEDFFYAPRASSKRLWILEEAQSLARTKFAQQALLEILEEPPDDCYFVICTTQPEKLDKAIRTRATKLKLVSLAAVHLEAIVEKALVYEQKTINGGVLTRLVDLATGSAREALKLLQQVIDLPTVEEQLESLVPDRLTDQASQLCRLLCSPKSTWPQVCERLRLHTGEPEPLRHLVLLWANGRLIKNQDAEWVALLIECFEKPFHDSGWPGFNAAAHEMFRRRSR